MAHDDGQRGDQELIRAAGKVGEGVGLAAMFKGDKGPGDGPPTPEAEATRGDDPKQPPPIEEGAARGPDDGPNGPLGGGGAAASEEKGAERGSQAPGFDQYGKDEKKENIFEAFERREAELKEMQEARYGAEADRSDAQSMLANEELAALRQADYQANSASIARGEGPVTLGELARSDYAEINEKATAECYRNMDGDQDFRQAVDRANEQAGAVQEISPEQVESQEVEQGADWRDAMQEGIDAANADIGASESMDADMDMDMDADMDMEAGAGADIGSEAGGAAAEAGADSVASHGAELALSR